MHPICMINEADRSVRLNANVSGHKFIMVAGTNEHPVLMCQVCQVISCEQGEYFSQAGNGR